MRIEKPEWNSLYELNCYCGTKHSNWSKAIAWFNENVEPINAMIEAGVEVYVSGGYQNMYTATTNPDGAEKKALLINIQPIKKEKS